MMPGGIGRQKEGADMPFIMRVTAEQPFLIQVHGRNLHLLLGRAAALSAEEVKSPQVQHLLKNGLARLEDLGKKPNPEAPAAKKKLKGHK